MAAHPPEEDQASVATAYANTGLRIEELWLAYFALGGNAGLYEIEAYLAGLMSMSAHEHNVVAHAVNERLAGLDVTVRASYRELDR